MSLQVASINSGSNGNCYYIGNDTDAVLVDAGISCREVEKRMRRIGLSMQKVKAIFISHEHGDHIKGVDVLSRRFGLPVYLTEKMQRYVKVDGSLVRYYSPAEPVLIGDVTVTAFPKFHDAIDPHSFVVSHSGTHVGVFTDIGIHCAQVIEFFRKCHACFLEANYDEAMLENGRYPYHLKNRIRGGHGHLSNRQALELFCAHRPEFMSHLFLSHLSRDNNDPQLVSDLFAPHAGNTQVVVASRYSESAVYHISGTGSTVVPGARLSQASLF
ncbi:MAG: MBL fold metallo-hydrolase [Flavipsychrobacter sp.]|nr:MBL fold metallo-hydrolase [Flavipsychrobacter sp.]